MRTLARCTSSPTARHEADETSPSIATTLSFSISFRAFCTATPGLASSSVISSTFRPRTPPFSFSSSTPSVAPCLPYSPMAPRKPVNGMSCPMRMGSCARTTAGNASSWVPAAAATVARPVRNLRRGRRVETSRRWAIWSPRERRVGRKWRTGGGLSSGFLGPILQGSVDSAERLEEAMGVTITLTAEDGQRLAGYRAAPPSAPRAGLVIVQEIFGVNSHIKKVCDGFAADGYVALAPAIFERVEPGFAIGYSPEDIERGRAVRMKIPLDDMVKDVRAAVQALAGEVDLLGLEVRRQEQDRERRACRLPAREAGARLPGRAVHGQLLQEDVGLRRYARRAARRVGGNDRPDLLLEPEARERPRIERSHAREVEAHEPRGASPGLGGVGRDDRRHAGADQGQLARRPRPRRAFLQDRLALGEARAWVEERYPAVCQLAREPDRVGGEPGEVDRHGRCGREVEAQRARARRGGKRDALALEERAHLRDHAPHPLRRRAERHVVQPLGELSRGGTQAEGEASAGNVVERRRRHRDRGRAPPPHAKDAGAQPDPPCPHRCLGEERRRVVGPGLGEEEAVVAEVVGARRRADDRLAPGLERHERDRDRGGHLARIRSQRPYSFAASMNHLTQSGLARGGSSHEVESTKRERWPTVSMQRRTSASTSAWVARSKMVTSTLPIATTPRWLPSVTSLSSWSTLSAGSDCWSRSIVIATKPTSTRSSWIWCVVPQMWTVVPTFFALK